MMHTNSNDNSDHIVVSKAATSPIAISRAHISAAMRLIQPSLLMNNILNSTVLSNNQLNSSNSGSSSSDQLVRNNNAYWDEIGG